MCKKSGKRESELAIDAFKELYVRYLLPDRKLLFFHEQDHEGTAVTNATVVRWAFEENLKTIYAEYVVALEKASHSNQTHLKSSVMKTSFDLLANKPENEKMLLSTLANKLGDQEKKLASKTMFLLRELVDMHPNMKGVVLKEINQLLYRANVSDRTQYYATVFLNQIILSRGERPIAEALIAIYFATFKRVVSAKNVNGRILSALLTGINRAFPYAQLKDEVYDEHVDSLFRMTHVANFNTCVQALTLLFQIMTARGALSDRFFCSLYAILLSAELRQSSKQGLFLNLLYKAIKADTDLKRVKAFVKRLLQTCVYAMPPYVCAVLFLVSQVTKQHPAVQSMISQKEEHLSDAEDEEPAEEEDEEADEKDKEAEDEEDEEGQAGGEENAKGAASPKLAHSDAHAVDSYDPMKRQPQFANAEKSCLWELVDLAQHFHPSVIKFSQALLNGLPIEYQGDPLKDLTLGSFLERFVFKNAKKIQQHRGSKMRTTSEVVAERDVEHPVNSAAFLAKGQQNIRPEEMFFFNYFANRKKKKVKTKVKEEDVEDVADEEADEFLRGLTSQDGDPEEEDEEFNMSEDEGDDEPFVYEGAGAADAEEEDGYNPSGDLPEGLDFSEMDGFGATEEPEEETEPEVKVGKRKKKEKLPKYASAEDYAHLLEPDEPEGQHMADDGWDDDNDEDDEQDMDLLMQQQEDEGDTPSSPQQKNQNQGKRKLGSTKEAGKGGSAKKKKKH